MHISHETIYRSLFIQTRGVLKKELLSELRTHRVMRRAKCASTRGQNRGTIINAVPISERLVLTRRDFVIDCDARRLVDDSLIDQCTVSK
ncbi:Integrase catalytic region [Burkholderia sp. YI23]|nr:Integrase catalytic region [Burkholderia sp. YI23]